jgi:uncharacterized membrane protein YraQ (UPF0718 family)
MIAMDLINQGLNFSYFLFLHFFRMMYWVWVPGFLLSAFFSLRYRDTARSRLLSGGGLFAALIYGITSSPSRKKALGIAGELKQKGVGTAKILAYLIASQNLVIYFLVILMAMMGAEFALGQLMGGIIMALLVVAGLRLLENEKPVRRDSGADLIPGKSPTWLGLLLSVSGWREALKYFCREFSFFWVNLAIGIILGGFILAAGLQKWSFELALIGNGGFLADIFNAFAAPIIAVILFVPPVGNILIVTGLFKSYAISYPGVVSFILASLVSPLILPKYFRIFGKRKALFLIGLIFLSAIASALLTTWAYALIGFRPDPVTMGRNFSHKIIAWLPFIMGKMSGRGM